MGVMLNELDRPQLTVSLDIDIPQLAPITHELDKVEDFANKLSEFYRNLIEDNAMDIATVKSERTKVRKALKVVADNRKAMVKAYKEPIKDFEDTSKRIEKILTNTDNALKELVDADKALNAEPIDPFAGLSTENYTVTLKSKNDYEKVLEFMKREGIDYE